MRRAVLLSTMLLTGYTFVPSVQNRALVQSTGLKLSSIAGTWEGRSMVGPSDSVFNTWVLKATASRKGWTLHRAGRAVLPVRIIAVGGDSIMYESGPFPSILRPGQTATTRFVAHFAGDTMTGTWEAHYKSQSV